MIRRTRSNRSGAHRLLFQPDLDLLAHGQGMWQDGPSDDSPYGARFLEALHDAIRTELTPRQREAVELFFFEGASQGDIARRFGVTQQVIHKCLYGDSREGRLVGGAVPRLRRALARYLEPSISIGP